MILAGKNYVLLNSIKEWLLGCFGPFSYVYTIKFYILSRIKEYRCLENVIHQIDIKSEWLLPSASFMAKFGLVFILTLENTFL